MVRHELEGNGRGKTIAHLKCMNGRDASPFARPLSSMKDRFSSRVARAVSKFCRGPHRLVHRGQRHPHSPRAMGERGRYFLWREPAEARALWRPPNTASPGVSALTKVFLVLFSTKHSSACLRLLCHHQPTIALVISFYCRLNALCAGSHSLGCCSRRRDLPFKVAYAATMLTPATTCIALESHRICRPRVCD